jgi:hypothetical protein
MTKTIKTRLDSLEAKSPDDHDWTIEIGMDETGQIRTRHYKDGVEVSLAQYHNEFKPTGGPINVKVTSPQAAF